LGRIISLLDCKKEEITLICHGATIGSDAIVERKGAKIGILTAKGFEDALLTGRQKRSNMYDLFMDPETPTGISQLFFGEIFRVTIGFVLKQMEKDGIPVSQVEIQSYGEMRYVGQS